MVMGIENMVRIEEEIVEYIQKKENRNVSEDEARIIQISIMKSLVKAHNS